MAKTPIALYRQGNANSPRMEGDGKNWWKLESNTEIPEQIELVNDHDNHWLWKPSRAILIDEYKAGLKLVGELFYKVS